MEIAEFATIFFLLVPVTYVVGYFTGKLDAEETHAKQQLAEGIIKLMDSTEDLAEQVKRTKKMVADEAMEMRKYNERKHF